MLLPDPKRRGEIQFVLARNWSYGRRLLVIVLLLAGGFALQAAVSLPAGAVLLFAASLLAVVKGFRNAPDIPPGPGEWRGASTDQFRHIVDIAAKSRRWDQSLLDISCTEGAITFVFLLIGVTVGAAMLAGAGQEWLAIAWGLDAAVLLLPHWVTGIREILINDPLTIKANLLLQVAGQWEDTPHQGQTLLPQMLVYRGPKGELPGDVKLVIQSKTLGPDFLGVQVQLVLNRVQGADYPYVYCVLVARPTLKMLARLRENPPRGILLEPSTNHEDNVEILVVRQFTTSTSGYHTDTPARQAIVRFALTLCRTLEQSVAGKKA